MECARQFRVHWPLLEQFIGQRLCELQPRKSERLHPYYLVIENAYCHGWTHTSGAGEPNGVCYGGTASYPGVVIQFSVCDGQDSDDLSGDCLGSNNNDAFILRYNVFRRFDGDQVSSSCHYVHDNLFEYYNLATDGGHGDNLFCEGEYAGGSSSPNLFFNNLFRYIGYTYSSNISYLLNMGTPGGQTDYVFNNVWHDNQIHNGGGNYIDDEGRSGNWIMFNNTGEIPSAGGNAIIQWTPGLGGSISSKNNHWISNPANQAQIYNNAPSSESNAVYMLNSTATTQGYVSSNDYQPTASNNSTVGAGPNETSVYCLDSVLHYAIAETECVNGTSLAVSYNSTNHSVSYPGITPNPRPSTGGWDVGAYEYGTASSSVQPPTNVSVVVQ